MKNTANKVFSVFFFNPKAKLSRITSAHSPPTTTNMSPKQPELLEISVRNSPISYILANPACGKVRILACFVCAAQYTEKTNWPTNPSTLTFPLVQLMLWPCMHWNVQFTDWLSGARFVSIGAWEPYIKSFIAFLSLIHFCLCTW